MNRLSVIVTLRSVDPVKCWQKYRIGDYFKDNINITTNKTLLTTPVTTSLENSNKRERIGTGVAPRYYVNTDCKPYAQCNTKGELRNTKGGRCLLCLEDYHHHGIGIPLYKITIDKETANPGQDGGFNSDISKWLYIYYMIGEFCCYEHVYLFLLRRCLDNTLTDKFKTSECIKLLKEMFHLQYPSDTLREVNDPLLLEINGGGLTQEELLVHKYVPTGNILLSNAYLEFERMGKIPVEQYHLP